MVDRSQSSLAVSTPVPWEGGECRVPMWSSGTPAGFCGEPAYGPQLPQKLFWARGADHRPYCFGPCCPNHGGPAEGEPILFHDGTTDHGLPMFCAVMPGFTNLQESPAGFSGDPEVALVELKKATLATGTPGPSGPVLQTTPEATP